MPLLYVHECKACAKRIGPDLANDLPPGWKFIAVWREGETPAWSQTRMICDSCFQSLLDTLGGDD